MVGYGFMFAPFSVISPGSMKEIFTDEVTGLKTIGVRYSLETSHVSVWAPFADQVQMKIKGYKGLFDLGQGSKGYWNGEISELLPGSYYKFIIDGRHELPDPASFFQPEGVHSWSEVVDHRSFEWTDQEWKPVGLDKMVMYELHVGTFSDSGDFDGVTANLEHLLSLGINAIELMPVCQFPGNRNWGYDGVFPFAVQNSYGGVSKLKHLVNECHRNGVHVILDVVYNHLGPEGNYLRQFGPYFTSKYKTPWGDAINYDDEYSDEVRNFFIQNAVMWLRDYHFDGLRLDAVHAIYDQRPHHFLKELRMRVADLESEMDKNFILIAESDLNDVKMVNGQREGGYDLQGVWADDFHHSLHALVTGEKDGYFSDFGRVEHFNKSFCQALVYDGVYSNYRKKTVGSNPHGIPPERFIVCIQNHDQVGNRKLGDRIASLVSFDKVKLLAGILLAAPFTPMLFMGEEYGEKNPFQYFVSHSDPELVKAVQEGRKKEFQDFEWDGEVPDPQAQSTFNHSKLHVNFEENSDKATLFRYYQTLISLRKEGVFERFRERTQPIKISGASDELLVFIGGKGPKRLLAAFNFSEKREEFQMPSVEKGWSKIIASSDPKWQGAYDLEATLRGNQKVKIPPGSIMFYNQLL